MADSKIVKGKGGDPFDYKKEGDKYYYRRGEDSKWVSTKKPAETKAVAELFPEEPESDFSASQYAYPGYTEKPTPEDPTLGPLAGGQPAAQQSEFSLADPNSAQQYIPDFAQGAATQDPTLGPLAGGVPAPQQQQRFDSPLDPSNPATYTPEFTPRVDPQVPTQGPLVGGTPVPQGPDQGFQPETTQVDATGVGQTELLDLAGVSPEVKGSDFRSNKAYKDYDYFKDDDGNVMFKSSPTAEPKRVTSKAALKEYNNYMTEKIVDTIPDEILPEEITNVIKPTELKQAIAEEATDGEEKTGRRYRHDAKRMHSIGSRTVIPAPITAYIKYMGNALKEGEGSEKELATFTEKNMNRGEKNAMRDTIGRNIRAGRGGKLDYRDYSTDPDIAGAESSQAALAIIKARGGAKMMLNPGLAMSQTVGGGSVYVDENGDIIVLDNYDFNYSQRNVEKQGATKEEIKEIDKNLTDFYEEKGVKRSAWKRAHGLGDLVKSQVPTTLNLGKASRFLSDDQIAQLSYRETPQDEKGNRQLRQEARQEPQELQEQQLAQNLPQQKYGGYLQGDSTPMGVNQSLPAQGLPAFADGGQIRIKPENRGKFTASAKRAGQGVQEHARSVLANPNATGLQKKRANFARNAAKWKKEDGGDLPTGLPEGSVQRDGNFYNPEGDTLYQYIPSFIGEPSRFIGSPISAYRPERLEGILGQTREQNIKQGLLHPTPTQPPQRQQYAGGLPPQANSVDQYIPQFGCGGKLRSHQDGGQINQSYGEGEGPGVNPLGLPKAYIGAIISGIVAIGGAISKGVQKSRAKKEALALQEQQAADMNRENELTSLELSSDQGVQNRGATFGFQDGGDIGSGLIDSTKNPQIVKYSNRADSHAQGSLGGIPVDELGNPSSTSKRSAVALTEGGEVAWNGYIFSDHLKV